MNADDVNFKARTRATVIKDSVSPDGHRLTTMEVTFHRFVLAEFNTHRVFSRNSASSRAIPFRKQMARIEAHPAMPTVWASEQRGMQGGEEIDDPERANYIWLKARNSASEYAKELAKLGVHKSIVNRILEPFMWHTVIVTATDWDGFFEQRCHEAAQPEIKVAADMMLAAYNASEPKLVQYGQWHMPYIDQEDHDAVFALIELEEGKLGEQYSTEGLVGRITTILGQVSAARCARVSYLTHDGKRAIEKDLELYARLVERNEGVHDPIHWSPLEHVATPARYSTAAAGEVRGNFTGWHQLRHWTEHSE